MSVMYIRDKSGNFVPVKTIKGENYILTEADKQEIAEQAAELVANPDSSALYLVDAQNPNFEEAYAAYEAGKILQMTNLPSNDSYTVNKDNRIDFYSYFQGAAFGNVTMPPCLNFFGLAWCPTIIGYAEVLAGLNPDNTCSITYQPLRGYLSTAVGGTMKAPLILNADPVEDLEASTKCYVDNSIAAAVKTPSGGSSDGEYISITTTETVSEIVLDLPVIKSEQDVTVDAFIYVPNPPTGTNNSAKGKVYLYSREIINLHFMSNPSNTCVARIQARISNNMMSILTTYLDSGLQNGVNPTKSSTGDSSSLRITAPNELEFPIGTKMSAYVSILNS